MEVKRTNMSPPIEAGARVQSISSGLATWSTNALGRSGCSLQKMERRGNASAVFVKQQEFWS